MFFDGKKPHKMYASKSNKCFVSVGTHKHGCGHGRGRGRGCGLGHGRGHDCEWQLVCASHTILS